MKTALKILSSVLVLIALVVLSSCWVYRPEPMPEGSESAARLAPGPWTVAEFEETFVDRSRPTQANEDFEGAPDRTMKGDVWYPSEAEAGASPLLVFSHGFTSVAENGRYLAEHLASHGFVVVAVDYPLTNMSAPGGPMLEDVAYQPGDVSFLIDTLSGYSAVAGHELSGKVDTGRIGVFGISLGGLTSTLVGYHPRWRDPRVDAVLSIAGPTSFFTPAFFETADPDFLMLAGEIDALVPFASNAAPIPEKVPGSILVSIADGSHTGFSGGTRWLQWMDNTDSLGCYSVMNNIEEGDEDDWSDLLGTAEEGINADVPNELCLVDPLPDALNPVRQQMIATLAIRAFFEQSLLDEGTRRSEAERFLKTGLAADVPEVTIVVSPEP